MEFFRFLGLSDLTWIGIIAFVLCLIFGLYMVITKRPGAVRKINDTSVYKDKEQYAVKGGRLILFLAGGFLIMTVLSFFSTLLSILFSFVALAVFAFFWKKMNDEYGPV